MSAENNQRHMLSILVEDRYGELARIVGLFSGRGFNIDSLAVNRTLEPGMSRVVLTTRGDAQIIEQITKQLNKLIRVHKVRHFVGDAAFERELCVATVKVASARTREDLERVLRLTGARVLAFAASTFTVEATGTSAEITQFIELIRPLGIRDMVRSAPIALARGGSEADLHAGDVVAAQ